MAGRPDALAPMQRDTLRQYCRNPRCGSKLPQPMGNVHAAFCTRGCWQQFHRHRCVVCERRLMHRQPLRRGGSRAPTQRDCPDIPEFLRRTAQQPLQPSSPLVPAEQPASQSAEVTSNNLEKSSAQAVNHGRVGRREGCKPCSGPLLMTWFAPEWVTMS